MKQIVWLLLITLLASCSTLNVRRNGYYQTIKYKNKKHRTTKNLSARTSENLISFLALEQAHLNKKQIRSLFVNTPFSIEQLDMPLVKTEEHQVHGRNIVVLPQSKEAEPTPMSLSKVSILNTNQMPIIFNTLNSFIKKETYINPAKETPASKLGTFLIVFGVLTCIASLILVFGYPTLENLFRSLVFSGNGLVAGLFGFLLFLLIVSTLALFVFLVEALLGHTIGFILGALFIIMGVIIREVES